jgi:hypothetical protein
MEATVMEARKHASIKRGKVPDPKKPKGRKS